MAAMTNKCSLQRLTHHTCSYDEPMATYPDLGVSRGNVTLSSLVKKAGSDLGTRLYLYIVTLGPIVIYTTWWDS